MTEFFIGLDQATDCQYFERSMLSVNSLHGRRKEFEAGQWMLDSGAFTEISTYGTWRHPVESYARQIDRWAHCGRLVAAVTQDMMCEPMILAKTGLNVANHQAITIERYVALIGLEPAAYVMPVLQGYRPSDYVAHLQQYGDLLGIGAWVGVGSVCRRNGQPEQIEDILAAIKSFRPDLRLHGFGLKATALRSGTVRSFLHSSDSMAWSLNLRKNTIGQTRNQRRAAGKRYVAKIEAIIQAPAYAQEFFAWST